MIGVSQTSHIPTLAPGVFGVQQALETTLHAIFGLARSQNNSGNGESLS